LPVPLFGSALNYRYPESRLRGMDRGGTTVR
jgi:hypothetical protein